MANGVVGPMIAAVKFTMWMMSVPTKMRLVTMRTVRHVYSIAVQVALSSGGLIACVRLPMMTM